MATAKKDWRRLKRINNGLQCKYDKGEWSTCDTLTQTVTRIFTLRKGEEACPPTQTQSISCEKYERIQAWKAQKVERKRERLEGKLLRKQQIKENRKLMKEQRKRCNYDYSDWSECDSISNTVSRVLTLRDGEEGCEQTQTITITCNKYNRIQTWKAMKMERKNKRKEQKLQMKQEKKEMKEKRKLIKEQRLRCKYNKGDWSECDIKTNTVTRVLTLRDASEEGCEPTLDVAISCARLERIQARKAKKMERKNEKMSQKLLMKEEKNQLKENKKMMKQQRRLGCSFDVSFSECDPTTQMVTKTYTPVLQDDDSCEAISVAYSCQLHQKLMEKKMKRQSKKEDRTRMRQEIRQYRKL